MCEVMHKYINVICWVKTQLVCIVSNFIFVVQREKPICVKVLGVSDEYFLNYKQQDNRFVQ